MSYDPLSGLIVKTDDFTVLDRSEVGRLSFQCSLWKFDVGSIKFVLFIKSSQGRNPVFIRSLTEQVMLTIKYLSNKVLVRGPSPPELAREIPLLGPKTTSWGSFKGSLGGRSLTNTFNMTCWGR